MLQDDIGYGRQFYFPGKQIKNEWKRHYNLLIEIEKKSNAALKVTPTGFPKLTQRLMKERKMI